jgi:hypothetical protein
MSSWGQNLFGIIAGWGSGASIGNGLITPGFVPTNSSGGIMRIRGSQASWLGLRTREMQKQAYEFCYPVSSVCDRLAEYDLTGVIEILRSKGKGKEDYATNPWSQRMNKLIAQPNPLQAWEQFRGQQVVYKKLFGFCPVFPVMPVGMDFDPSYCMAIWNLPPWLFRAEPTNKLLEATDIDEIIKSYSITIHGKKVTLTGKQVFILEDGFIQDENENFLLPQSKLVGLDMAVSNICAAMEADNVLLRKKGPLGFISSEAVKDAAGYIPMRPEEKKELQEALQVYGLSWDQYQYVISRTPSKWNPMSYDVNQLGTKETVIAGSKAVCQKFGFPYVLFEETGVTYANGENAMSSVYVNNVIPNAKKDLNKYNKFFKAEENQCKINACYDDVPALQEDELNKNTAAYSLAQTLAIEYKNGIITKNQWLTARGYDTVPDGDLYYGQRPTDPNEAIPIEDAQVIEEEDKEIFYGKENHNNGKERSAYIDR